MTESEWLASNDPAAMLRFLPEVWALRTEDSFPSSATDRKLRLFACACCRQVWHLLTDDAPCPGCDGRGRIEANRTGYTICSLCDGSRRVNRSRRAVEVAERYADGEATESERKQAEANAWAVEGSGVQGCAWAAVTRDMQYVGREMHEEYLLPATQAGLLRCIVGNPFRPVTIPWEVGPQVVVNPKTRMTEFVKEYRWCPWLTPAVVKVARSIYDDRRFEELPILADALEEVGCTEAALLGHLRELARCPECNGNDAWRYGEGFTCDTCHCAGTVPAPHARGCWVLDLILGRE